MIYDYTLTTGKGEELKLSEFRGKVILVVNTATGCGFTPQYAPIEQLYKDYHDQGLEILDIPCNQFGGQAPGTDDEIHEFCTMHFNTTFPQMKKADVNGENELPLYTYLKSQKGFEGFGEHQYKALLEKMFADMLGSRLGLPHVCEHLFQLLLPGRSQKARLFRVGLDGGQRLGEAADPLRGLVQALCALAPVIGGGDGNELHRPDLLEGP